MKIVTILGARPQFIKAGSVSREIVRQQKSGKNIQEVIVHTGQHYDPNMSDIFFREMHLPKPDYFLGVGGKTHGAMTGQMIEKIEDILAKEKPDWVMVYGDTNSTLAGAIAASKLHIKIAHVEAGLRSFNMSMPEEVNRILTDRISSILFCPAQAAVENLNREGICNWKTDVKVVLSGDVMFDGAVFYKELSQRPQGLVVDDGYVLSTIHRAENTDDPVRLANIVAGLNEIARTRQVILPLHPRTKRILQSGSYDTSNLTIIDPVGYLNMVWLIDRCGLVITDSGGLQKEAYFFNKPCLTCRDETEWTELVELGVNTLVGSHKVAIVESYQRISRKKKSRFPNNVYGNGQASEIIISELLR
ncbi:UDP-N-acetylglucosamine 2-epimerase (non-hydrolyzing) [Porticoccaceae bacterium]|nr:UDP-N-acetylglucosamine 2-epimerase (non-hydrolyzing) [Porticoccaceae bacterium]